MAGTDLATRDADGWHAWFHSLLVAASDIQVLRIRQRYSWCNDRPEQAVRGKHAGPILADLAILADRCDGRGGVAGFSCWHSHKICAGSTPRSAARGGGRMRARHSATRRDLGDPYEGCPTAGTVRAKLRRLPVCAQARPGDRNSECHRV